MVDWRARFERFYSRRRGRLDRLRDVWSPQLRNRRDLVIYLPPAYGGRRRFPVVYMQDGQNLFDAGTSYAGEWGLRESLDALTVKGVAAIIVGVSNGGGERIAEYSPFVDAHDGGGRGDLYLSFLTDTVKPLIDGRFSTRPERSQTGIAGSSMGGLISLYGCLRRPEVFGLAAALSPSVWFADRAIIPFVASAAFVPGRMYLDVGAQEGDRHVANARAVRDALLAKSYSEGRDLQYVEDPCGAHDEAAWGRRFPRALSFLVAGSLPDRSEL